jgi:hypothetical protein
MKSDRLDSTPIRLFVCAASSIAIATALGCSGSGASVPDGGVAQLTEDGGTAPGTPITPLASSDAGSSGSSHDASLAAPPSQDSDASSSQEAAAPVADASVACGSNCKLVFVTSESFKGDLHGSAGADSKCRTAAAASTNADIKSRASRFIAWVSTGFPGWPGPGSRLVDAEYRRGDGVLVAQNRDALLGGRHLAPIDLTELGDSAGAAAAVWTGTAANGTTSTFTCNGWSTSLGAFGGDVGAPQETGPAWTIGQTTTCNESQRLYCIEAAE